MRCSTAPAASRWPPAIRQVDRAAFSFRRGDAKARGGCALHLEVEAIGRESLHVSTFITSLHGLSAPRLVLATGETVELEALALLGGTRHNSTSVELEPGERGTLLLVPKRRYDADAEPPPALVTVGAEDGPHRAWLRLP